MPVPDGTIVSQLVAFAAGLGGADPATTLVASVVLALLLLLHHFAPLPGPLVVVILAATAVTVSGTALQGVDAVGPIPAVQWLQPVTDDEYAVPPITD